MKQLFLCVCARSGSCCGPSSSCLPSVCCWSGSTSGGRHIMTTVNSIGEYSGQTGATHLSLYCFVCKQTAHACELVHFPNHQFNVNRDHPALHSSHCITEVGVLYCTSISTVSHVSGSCFMTENIRYQMLDFFKTFR